MWASLLLLRVLADAVSVVFSRYPSRPFISLTGTVTAALVSITEAIFLDTRTAWARNYATDRRASLRALKRGTRRTRWGVTSPSPERRDENDTDR